MGVLDKLQSNKSKRGVRTTPNPAHAGGPLSPAEPDVSPPGVLRDANGRLMKGTAPVNRTGRPKGVEAQLREMLARGNADEAIESIISGAAGVDWRLRWEVIRWAHERANGKALERSQNVNLAVGQGEAAPLPVDRLSAAARRELLEAMSAPAQLEAGEVIEADFRPADLPATDPVPAQQDKTEQ